MTIYTTLIQPAQLSALLHDATAGVLVCDCSFSLADAEAGARIHQAGHIPGAVHLDLNTVLSGAKTGANGRHPLPRPEDLAARLAALGAGPDTQIVAYDEGDAMFAARLWWLARWLGHPRVAVLDGGLAAWRRAGLPIEAADAVPGRGPGGALTAGTPLVDALDYEAVLEATGTGTRVIVDARAPDRFRGENETLDPVGGHIPGARNRFFRQNLDPDGCFKPAETLRAEFEAVLGGRSPAEMVSQCGSGVTACHNLLAMEIAGLGGAALYPGSWSEWSAQPGAPIATGEA